MNYMPLLPMTVSVAVSNTDRLTKTINISGLHNELGILWAHHRIQKNLVA